MKKTFLALLIASLMLSGCSILASGLSNMDPTALATAANTAMTALTISDEQIAQLSAQSVAYMDSVNKIDKGAYDARLRKLMSKVKTVDGVPINLKVYRTNEVNAFACGDGSIRVYSGLMDVMDDSELMAVIGHEIGHVLHKDTKNAMKKTYMAYAARIALGSTGSVLGSLSTSVLGDIAQSYLQVLHRAGVQSLQYVQLPGQTDEDQRGSRLQALRGDGRLLLPPRHGRTRRPHESRRRGLRKIRPDHTVGNIFVPLLPAKHKIIRR